VFEHNISLLKAVLLSTEAVLNESHASCCVSIHLPFPGSDAAGSQCPRGMPQPTLCQGPLHLLLKFQKDLQKFLQKLSLSSLMNGTFLI